MEESKLTNEEDISKESSSKIEKEFKNDEKEKSSYETLEKASNKDVSQQNSNPNFEKINQSTIKSLFERIRNEGIDGITTNPNQKMLALLIILLINMSVFLAIGNFGKAYLRNAGIM